METFIEKLDQLVALKKIKGHKVTKGESEEFASALEELIIADGCFSDRAESYLYDGLIYSGAKPFVSWVISSEDRHLALNTLFEGKLYGKDTASTFRVLMSTLSLIIKADLQEKDLITPIVKRLPVASRNKENKTIGDGHRVFLKYFVNEIEEQTVLPSLSEAGLNQGFIDSFVRLIDELCSRIEVDKLSVKEHRMIDRINEWLHPEIISENSKEETAICSQADPALATEKIVEPLTAQLSNALQHISDIVGLIYKDFDSQKSSLFDLLTKTQKENDSLIAQVELLEQKEESLIEQLTDKQRLIVSLDSQIQELNRTNEQLSNALNEKNEEILQRTQMMEALSRDRAKQSDELVHRIGAKLKVEYKDFKDAECLPMDSDLGENMREQLKNVFSILSKSGISLE